MRRNLFTACLILVAAVTHGQLKEGKKNILQLCGCYDVDFMYAETFAPDTTYKFHDREFARGRELVLPIEVSDKRIVLQHLLVSNRGFIIKHWREDWTYENAKVLRYSNDKLWVNETLKAEEVKGRWTQSVWEVSDAPRYQGVSEWVTTDGKTFWQNTTDAPLPRREYTTRNDYNILRRTNRIVLTSQGWVHEQDNQKIVRTAQGDKLLAEEKGFNTYKKIADSECAKAKEWWDKNQQFWGMVRKTWDDYIKNNQYISLVANVNGETLNEKLDKMAKDYAASKINGNAETLIRDEIARFLKKGGDVAQQK